jgi:cell division protein FtsZ
MQLIIKDEAPLQNITRTEPAQPELRMELRTESFHPASPAQDSLHGGKDENDEQKRKAAERLQKLRNLSFNVNAPDGGNEFEAVPAYVRRNMELYNTVNSIENFYSNYTVKPAENNKGEISTLNTFLEGKKPD